MTFLLRETELGQLSTVEVFYDYDGPKLFVATNRSDQLFLVFWLGSTEAGDRWLYLPVSPTRLAVIKSGEVDLRTACLEPEDGWVYGGEVLQYPPDRVQALTPADLGELDLPGEGAGLNFDVEETPWFDVESTLARAIRTRGEVLDLGLITAARRRSTVLAKTLGSALLQTQETLTALVLSQEGYRHRRGRVPEELILESELHAVATFPSSFGVSLESGSLTDLLEENRLRNALRDLFEILEAEEDEERLAELADRLGARVFARVTALLGVISSSHVDVKLHWASPVELEQEATVTWRSAERRVERLKMTVEAAKDETVIRSRLDGIDIHRKTFDLVDLESNERLTGRVADEMIQTAERVIAQIPREYDAAIIITQEVNPITGDVRERYRLIGLEEID